LNESSNERDGFHAGGLQAVPHRENEMNPSSAREKLAVIQESLFLKKQEVIRKNAEIARLTVELEDLHRRIAALQNRPTESGDA
jgi:hypothetical protein